MHKIAFTRNVLKKASIIVISLLLTYFIAKLNSYENSIHLYWFMFKLSWIEKYLKYSRFFQFFNLSLVDNVSKPLENVSL